MWMIDVQL